MDVQRKNVLYLGKRREGAENNVITTES